MKYEVSAGSVITTLAYRFGQSSAPPPYSGSPSTIFRTGPLVIAKAYSGSVVSYSEFMRMKREVLVELPAVDVMVKPLEAN